MSEWNSKAFVSVHGMPVCLYSLEVSRFNDTMELAIDNKSLPFDLPQILLQILIVIILHILPHLTDSHQ